MSDQTVGNILKRHDTSTASERKKATTWKEFIHSHWDVLAATDFFTADVWTFEWPCDVLRPFRHGYWALS